MSAGCSSVAEQVLQLVLNGLMAGAVLAMPALGFNAIYAVLRFPNFALGGLATAGWGWPVAPSLLLAFAAAAVVGLLGDAVALSRLRRSGPLVAAIGSVALGVLLENVARLVWGNDLRSYDVPLARDWAVGGLRVGPQAMTDAAWALGVMAALFALLRLTRIGKALRAVADNAVLAELKGIDPALAARIAVGVGAGLAGLGGMLLGLDTGVDPMLGGRLVLSAFAAAVAGGLGSIPGAVLGAFVIGVGEELSLLVLDPAYRTAVGFAVIVVMLSVRPGGLLGHDSR